MKYFLCALRRILLFQLHHKYVLGILQSFLIWIFFSLVVIMNLQYIQYSTFFLNATLEVLIFNYIVLCLLSFPTLCFFSYKNRLLEFTLTINWTVLKRELTTLFILDSVLNSICIYKRDKSCYLKYLFTHQCNFITIITLISYTSYIIS